MDFFKQTWVTVVAFIMFAISIVLLVLNGYTEVDVKPIFEQIFVILDLVSILLVAIKKLLQKKDSANK